MRGNRLRCVGFVAVCITVAASAFLAGRHTRSVQENLTEAMTHGEAVPNLDVMDTLWVRIHSAGYRDVILPPPESRRLVDFLAWLILRNDVSEGRGDPAGVPLYEVRFYHKCSGGEEKLPVCWIRIDYTPEVWVYTRPDPPDKYRRVARYLPLTEAQYELLRKRFIEAIGGKDLEPLTRGIYTPPADAESAPPSHTKT